MMYCNDHHLISERKVLLNLKVNLNLPCFLSLHVHVCVMNSSPTQKTKKKLIWQLCCLQCGVVNAPGSVCTYDFV